MTSSLGKVTCNMECNYSKMRLDRDSIHIEITSIAKTILKYYTIKAQ